VGAAVAICIAAVQIIALANTESLIADASLGRICQCVSLLPEWSKRVPKPARRNPHATATAAAAYVICGVPVAPALSLSSIRRATCRSLDWIKVTPAWKAFWGTPK